MPEITSRRPSCRIEDDPVENDRAPADAKPADSVVARVNDARAGLSLLLAEAELARRGREEAGAGDGGSAVCAWNHFENIPTFYNWNNRPR